MSSHFSTQPPTEKHLQLWIYFLPLVGFIPALWTLYCHRNHSTVDCQNNPLIDYPQLQQQLKASRQSLNLNLAWLCSYILFAYGSTSTTELVAFRLLFAQAIATTGYFVTCTFFMTRLGKKKLFSID